MASSFVKIWISFIIILYIKYEAVGTIKLNDNNLLKSPKLFPCYRFGD